MEDELTRKIRAYVNGEAGADIFDARDRRHIRVLLKGLRGHFYINTR